MIEYPTIGVSGELDPYYATKKSQVDIANDFIGMPMTTEVMLSIRQYVHFLESYAAIWPNSGRLVFPSQDMETAYRMLLRYLKQYKDAYDAEILRLKNIAAKRKNIACDAVDKELGLL